MSLRILYVAYPLLAISDTSCGGAEQVLLTLDREMVRRGHRTAVAAAEGSEVDGELYPTGKPVHTRDALAERDAEHNQAILRLLANERFDLVHDMSGSFWRFASKVDAPVIATLHLPPSLYRAGMFDSLSLNLYFNCVSRAQLRHFRHLPRILGVVENGIDLSRLGAPTGVARGDFLLWMGRICEEKAPHIAIEVAIETGDAIVIAGQVYPFSYHEEYFAREIAPRLKRYSRARFVSTPIFQEKLELLDGARSLLITSQIDETSSLVAMEAMARATPVIAFRRGALPEVVQDGGTGFVVDTMAEMAAAVNRIDEINPAACRERIERLYTSARMCDDYLRLYDRVLGAQALRRGIA